MICTEIYKLYLNGGTLLTFLSFFALALFCFSLALGPDEGLLNRSAPGLLWILAILTFLFSTPMLLKAEYQAGLLDEVALQPVSPVFYFLAKIGAEVLLFGLPLLGICIVFAPFFSLSFVESIYLSLTLLIGLPALSGLGIWGGLLTLQARGGSLLISLLILPLTIPLLLFSLSAMEMARLGLDSFPSFCLLTSVSILVLMVSIAAGQWALSFAVEG